MEAVYLDTHVVAWLYSGDLSRFSEKTIELMEGSTLYYSSIVKLELKYLQEIGRLRVSPEAILGDLQSEIGLELKDSAIQQLIYEANKLSWTRDPFDRLITAQASVLHLPLVTKDKTIHLHYTQAVW